MYLCTNGFHFHHLVQLVTFANPDKDELQAICAIQACVVQAGSLSTNMSKSEVFPIRCDSMDISDILFAFPANSCMFPWSLPRLTSAL
jgi:hypothetical protein